MVLAVSNECINPLFNATEEAIISAMVATKTMTGIDGHTVIGLPYDELRKALKQYSR